jgi:hypothetical protein
VKVPRQRDLLKASPTDRRFLPVNWFSKVRGWQALPEETRLAQAWDKVPASVAASMAFEGEPVSLKHLKQLHRGSARCIPVTRIPLLQPASPLIVSSAVRETAPG